MDSRCLGTHSSSHPSGGPDRFRFPSKAYLVGPKLGSGYGSRWKAPDRVLQVGLFAIFTTDKLDIVTPVSCAGWHARFALMGGS